MAQRIGARIELARQYALQRNREWGVFVERHSYYFAELDTEQGRWVEQEYRPFVADAENARIAFRVEIEGLAVDSLDDSEDELPDIILFSSGEATPFRWYLEPVWDSLPWAVSCDGLSESLAERQQRRRR